MRSFRRLLQVVAIVLGASVLAFVGSTGLPPAAPAAPRLPRAQAPTGAVQGQPNLPIAFPSE